MKLRYLAMGTWLASIAVGCDDGGGSTGGDTDATVRSDGGGGAGGDAGQVDGGRADRGTPDAEVLADGGRVDGGRNDRGLPDGDLLPDADLPPDGDLPGDAGVDQGADQGPAECAEGAERSCGEACPNGIETCTDGAWGPCAAPAETCNGADDDCDGNIDEDFADLNTACSLGQGACAAAGVVVCTADGNGATCNAPVIMAQAETCEGTDEDCDGSVDENLDEACAPEGPDNQGLCAGGMRRCVDGALTACEASNTPQDEICDGLDNDCDGVTDEAEGGVALVEPCYEGPAGTQGQGACRGGQRTCAAGVFGACDGQVLPGAEICDSVDNDCNGQVDDADVSCSCRAGESRACYTGPAGTEDVGTCAGGTQSCLAPGMVFGPCFDTVPEAEQCDGLDNDCDGTSDEDVAGVDANCSVGLGVCQRSGVTLCDPDRSEVVCDVEPGAAGVETCNGLDDDCDGQTDEALGLGTACEVGLGLCRSAGRIVCDAAGGVVCDAMAGAPRAELCNTEDDDCDGQVDEDLGVGGACSAGVGACARDGVLACDPQGQVLCTASAGAPGAEACDGADNDCDGIVDEGNPGGGQDCDTGNPGICARGQRRCVAAAFVCVQQAVPGDEVCDGLDNDCDGTVDQSGGVALSRSCYSGPAGTQGTGTCVGGTETCAAGRFGACAGEVVPRPEVCDRADNDCNGQVDDIPAGTCVCQPGARQACYGGPEGTRGVGVCTAGSQTCAADGTGFGACVGEVLPTVERCDAADNDCNGTVDDVAGAGIACSAGVGACLAAGQLACDVNSGNLACNAVPGTPQREICDNLDNDCNGQVDDVRGLGDRCTGGEGECAAPGNFVCDLNTQALACNAVPGAPRPEICDGRDQDCDGTTDEDSPGLGDRCLVGVGACRVGGATVCNGNAGIACDAVPRQPSPEVCDRVDNDCNGTVDDQPVDVGQACSAGTGACATPGLTQCAAGVLSCSGVPGNPTGPDLCNGIDDDCDGGTDEGLDCTVYRSCAQALEAGVVTSGVYVIAPDGIAANAKSVYCDQVTDGGGWTLVGSTRDTTMNDEASAWYADLTTLAPAAPHTGVWNGLRPLGARFDVRFACRAAVGAANLPFDVDLGFYDVSWYREITTGADVDSCFSENSGYGADAPVPARRDFVGNRFRRRGDQYDAGYLEGEDACGDTLDFTVDFDNRGMDGNQGDGTDWGEDDGARKCGVSGLATGQWFVFARERPRVAVVGLQPGATAVLRAQGLLATRLDYDAALPGRLTTEAFDTIVIGRYALDWALMTQALKEALEVFGRNGGNVVTEWDGAAIFMQAYDASFRYSNGAASQLAWFGGRIGGGASRGANTPVTVVAPSDPAMTGTPNPFRAGGAAEFFYWLKDVGGAEFPVLLNTRTLATFSGGVAGFPDAAYGAIYRGRYCDGNAIFSTFDWSDDAGNAGFGTLIGDMVRSASAPAPADVADQCKGVRRTRLMLCGGAGFDLTNLGLGLQLVNGCNPDVNTQALFVTRTGAANLPAAGVLQGYLDGGGIIITEYSSSDEVFNSVFGAAVVQPAGRGGDCVENVMPSLQLSPENGFWNDNRFVATPNNQAGCGFDLSAYPSITPLGGWEAGQVQLAYRNRGPGRLWLVESDWQDSEVKSPTTLGLLRYMATHAGTDPRSGNLVEAGVQNNRPVSAYLKDGFVPCHRSGYGDIVDLSTIQDSCQGDVLVMGCRPAGAPNFQVSAMGRRAEVFEDVGIGAAAVNTHNGVNWYFNGSKSWGFAPAGAAVNRNSCDTLNDSPAQRLCWHTNADRVTSGWRCGADTGLGAANGFERVVLHRSGRAPN